MDNRFSDICRVAYISATLRNGCEMTKKTVSVRFTIDEYTALQRRVNRRGYKKNEPFLRDLALGRFGRDDKADGIAGLRHDGIVLLNDAVWKVSDNETRKRVLRAARRMERAMRDLEVRHEN